MFNIFIELWRAQQEMGATFSDLLFPDTFVFGDNDEIISLFRSKQGESKILRKKRSNSQSEFILQALLMCQQPEEEMNNPIATLSRFNSSNQIEIEHLNTSQLRYFFSAEDYKQISFSGYSFLQKYLKEDKNEIYNHCFKVTYKPSSCKIELKRNCYVEEQFLSNQQQKSTKANSWQETQNCLISYEGPDEFIKRESVSGYTIQQLTFITKQIVIHLEQLHSKDRGNISSISLIFKRIEGRLNLLNLNEIIFASEDHIPSIWKLSFSLQFKKGQRYSSCLQQNTPESQIENLKEKIILNELDFQRRNSRVGSCNSNRNNRNEVDPKLPQQKPIEKQKKCMKQALQLDPSQFYCFPDLSSQKNKFKFNRMRSKSTQYQSPLSRIQPQSDRFFEQNSEQDQNQSDYEEDKFVLRFYQQKVIESLKQITPLSKDSCSNFDQEADSFNKIATNSLLNKNHCLRSSKILNQMQAINSDKNTFNDELKYSKVMEDFCKVYQDQQVQISLLKRQNSITKQSPQLSSAHSILQQDSLKCRKWKVPLRQQKSISEVTGNEKQDQLPATENTQLLNGIISEETIISTKLQENVNSSLNNNQLLQFGANIQLKPKAEVDQDKKSSSGVPIQRIKQEGAYQTAFRQFKIPQKLITKTEQQQKRDKVIIKISENQQIFESNKENICGFR